MFEIKLTLDASPALIGALQDLAGAIHAVTHPVSPLPEGKHCGPLTPRTAPAELREMLEKIGTPENAPNLTAEAPIEAERPETPETAEEPKKRKPRSKKAHSEPETPAAPAVETPAEPEPAPAPEIVETAPVVETPAPAAPETPAEPAPAAPETPAEPAVEAPAAPAVEAPAAPAVEAPAAPAEDPLAGKGQTGEILAELTRKAIGDLDALGVDRCDANRRIRDYCAHNDLKFPTFPALLNAVGYAEAIAICKG